MLRVTVEVLEQTERGKVWRRIFEQVVEKLDIKELIAFVNTR